MPEFSITENWELWHERLELHFLEIKCSDDTDRVSTLLKTIGSEAYAILRGICSPALPCTKSYKELCEILQQQFTPPVIVFNEIKRFYAAKRAESESVSAWFARVKKLAVNCKFGAALDTIILHKFVVELPGKIFEKICEEDEKLTLSKALQKALIRETKLAQSSNDIEVNYIKQRGKFNNKNYKSNAVRSNNNNSKASKVSKCTHCGWKNHQSNTCKFKNSTCHFCGSVGHLANICNRKLKTLV
ncbi:uncharacterized protein LOC118744789 isoform X2 [Rhagoletis pomonella]|uniref:uncharacterized protein LOC118744789 isoform X2 n=1 Tax=Rhagoletis pomonella TaxID=28610 RepID=UPI001781F455|nr:uncharacterized protein LOC118744789 isoform X2 [Rhagoletis pomonella]